MFHLPTSLQYTSVFTTSSYITIYLQTPFSKLLVHHKGWTYKGALWTTIQSVYALEFPMHLCFPIERPFFELVQGSYSYSLQRCEKLHCDHHRFIRICQNPVSSMFLRLLHASFSRCILKIDTYLVHNTNNS